MGGKTKQAPRVKNNARPSSSGRSAELLGSTVPTFVGFATHSDLGMVPFAPGFSTVESFPETFDSNITPEYQLILRKLSKKDPVTKVKALQELNSQILDSDIEIIKTILPLWPKFYQNLSNDVEHRVRESTQTVQNNISLKVGKSIAPYIKLLAPIWIASRFDNYVPAGSTALSSFKSSFPPHKIQEVFLFCQNEIVDYLIRNLTFHTASTLSNMKIVTPQDAENKYQRVIISSMKTLCLFLEETTSKSNLEVDEKLKILLQNQKFWSFVKHKNNNIKSAFFEFLSAVVQYAPRLVENNKSQVIQICFQNLDDLDPLSSPHIWECILCIQTTFNDWHEQINFKKVIQPKFNNIFKILENGGASSISRNFLPFLSQLSEKDIKDLSLFEFYTDFFDNIKAIIQSSFQNNTSISKSDITSLIISYFECLRYVFKKISNDIERNKSLSEVYPAYLQKYIIDFLQWSLEKESVLVKSIYKNCAALIAYWANNSKTSCYSELLQSFWSNFLNIITSSVSAQNMEEINVKNVIELIRHLYTATPALHDNKVKFGENYNCDERKGKQNDQMKLKCSNYVANDLKEVVIKIIKTYLENPTKNESNKYAAQLKLLCQMFGDIDFYISLSPDKNILSTLSKFVEFIQGSETLSEDVVDIIFDIISLLDKNEKFKQLQNITKVKDNKAQLWILQRILSYPLCVEPEITEILAEKNVKDKILQIAKEAVIENSTEKFNLLQKCFFQIDSGSILIDQETVEGIINILLEPLCKPGNETMIDSCGSFIAQLMPVMCTDENTKKEFQCKIFMELFKFSINTNVNENLSEDTLWEISTCWQDSLSSKDILPNESILLDCRNIVENKLKSSTELSIQEVDNISDSAAQLILNSTKSCNTKRETAIDLLAKEINIFLNFTNVEKTTFNNVDNICKFFESLQNIITVDNIINDYIKNLEDKLLTNFYRKIYFTISVIYKIICDQKTNLQDDTENENNNEDNMTDKDLQSFGNEQLCDLITYCLAASALGESIIKNSDLVNKETEAVILNLTEKVNLFLNNSSDFSINLLKEKIFKKVLNGEILWLRTLPIFLSTKIYQQYGESGPILLMEEVSDSLLNNGHFEIYNNLAEVFLPYLNQRSLILNADVIKKADNIKFCSSFFKNVLINHMSSNDYSEMDDKNLVQSCIKFITETGEKQTINKEKFLYNEDISIKEFKDVIAIVEFIKLLDQALQRFPNELNIKNWDSIRIGLCSWVLTISKSIDKCDDSKVLLFIVSVFELFASLSKFIKAEKLKSSTQFHSSVIDEWENVFSKEVNLVLFKNYYTLIKSIGKINKACLSLLLDKVATCVIHLDYNIIYNACEAGFKLNINDLLEFSLDHLLGHRTVRKASANILKCISINLMKKDLEKFERNNETLNAIEKSGEDWHFLKKFEPYLDKYGQNIEKFINEFSYKLSELQDLKQIDKEYALTFFYIWDCIIYIFSKSPVELKSLYASWITNNKLENLLLNFIFRAMPLEILRNHDQKSMNNDVFKTNLWESQFQDGTLSVEKCACYMYTQMLRYLPVVLRKWWNGTHARQKNFIDKLTTNFVSNLIWVEDLNAINKTDKQENMQITVHQSTREVIAVYSIDEARMELIITLPQNHPLGVIKVEMGKQIGGKSSSRNIGMQLTIFLTHQNGSIFDGLLLWKKNLDKKFSGVEECYVCYTVIHQDTCQLPKLTCKTCKKKFHGPCLYKWFTTSSKSTCPLCRNVF